MATTRRQTLCGAWHQGHAPCNHSVMAWDIGLATLRVGCARSARHPLGTASDGGTAGKTHRGSLQGKDHHFAAPAGQQTRTRGIQHQSHSGRSAMPLMIGTGGSNRGQPGTTVGVSS